MKNASLHLWSPWTCRTFPIHIAYRNSLPHNATKTTYTNATKVAFKNSTKVMITWTNDLKSRVLLKGRFWPLTVIDLLHWKNGCVLKKKTNKEGLKHPKRRNTCALTMKKMRQRSEKKLFNSPITNRNRWEKIHHFILTQMFFRDFSSRSVISYKCYLWSHIQENKNVKRKSIIHFIHHYPSPAQTDDNEICHFIQTWI